jgi:hypothetical protein
LNSPLKSITIPASITEIGDNCFKNCESLESVVFEPGSRLERIEKYAFWGNGLKSIVIPASITEIGDNCFKDCKSLESVVFEPGSRLERIGQYAFWGSRLNRIVIPTSVTEIGDHCFGWNIVFESDSKLEKGVRAFIVVDWKK